MARLCGTSTLSAGRHLPETKISTRAENLARGPDVMFSERLASQRAANVLDLSYVRDTFADDVVSELKKLLEGQAMLSHMIEKQHREVSERFDQQWGLLASEAERFTQPVVQPSAASHEEPPVPCVSLGQLPPQHEHNDLPAPLTQNELSQAPSQTWYCSDPCDGASPSPTGDVSPGEDAAGQSRPAKKSSSALAARLNDDKSIWERTEELFEHKSTVPAEKASWHSTTRRVLVKYGELIMGAIIVLNMAVICMELQIKGETKLAYEVGIVDTPGNWEDHEARFTMVELFFTIIYTLELLARLKAEGIVYLKEAFNVVDAIVVFVSALQAFILRPLTGTAFRSDFSIIIVRILKLARIMRVLKVLRFMHSFSELRILLKTILSSFFSLMWSGILVLVVVVSSGIVMFQTASMSITNGSTSDETRLYLYDHFGTWSRATYTMFEATFSTAWAPKAAYMVREVHSAYVIFWAFHVVVVNFALMRIVAALFLKQTMQVAAVDAEQAAMLDLKKKERYAHMLSAIFRQADTSGDGSLSAEEFAEMMVNPHVMAMFEKMDIDSHEVQQLFAVLVEDDGQADYYEFLAAALQMKNSARCIEAIQIMHQVSNIRKVIIKVERQNQAMSQGLDGLAARFSAMDAAASQLQVAGGARLAARGTCIPTRVPLPGPAVATAAGPVSAQPSTP